MTPMRRVYLGPHPLGRAEVSLSFRASRNEKTFSAYILIGEFGRRTCARVLNAERERFFWSFVLACMHVMYPRPPLLVLQIASSTALGNWNYPQLGPSPWFQYVLLQSLLLPILVQSCLPRLP